MSDPSLRSSADIDRENPWPGLASFTEDAREFFFGREKETDELVRFIKRSTLTVLFGQSGLGKSSLLQAGVFPLLREGDFLPLYLRLDHGPESPPLAEQVKSALIAAFASAHADAPGFGVSETLWEYFHRKDVDIWSAKNRLLTPVLAFDQFEEIFTLGRTDQAARDRSRAFLDELACLVENRAPAAVRERLDRGELDPSRFNFNKPSCQVVLSLREDYLPDLEGLKQDMPTLVHNRMRLKRLNGMQALEIVSRPAPHLLAEGVAARIVEFVAGARGGSVERLAELDVEPPLLSVICRELNERRRALGQRQITADLVSGNRREILTDFYERSVADLPAPMRGFVEDRLLTKSGFRDNLALETALEEPGVTRPLLDTLVTRRLLRIEDRLGTQRVELTHDVLAEVIRASRDSRQQRLALEQAQAREQQAIATAARRARRQRVVIAALGVVVVGLSVGAFFGIRAQLLAAKRAAQADLQFASQALTEGKVSDGLAYLVRAARRDPRNPIIGPRIISELVNHSFLLPEGPPIPLPSPALGFGPKYSADGKRIFFQGEDGVIRVLDTQTWQIAREFRFASKAVPYYWSLAEKNEEVLAAGLEDGSIVVCDARDGTVRMGPVRPKDTPSAGRLDPVLSPDGRWVAAGSGETIWVWDVTTGEERWKRAPVNASARWIKFSPDSREIGTDRPNAAGVIDFWSLADFSKVHELGRSGVPGALVAANVAFSPDGRRAVMVHAGGVVQVVELSGGGANRRVTNLGMAVPGSSVVFAPDSSRAIIASDRFVHVVDLERAAPAYPPLPHGGRVAEPMVSRDGSVLLTNCVDGLARVWDLKSGRLLAEPTLQQERYSPAVLSPAGDQVVLFTTDGSAYRLRVGRGAAESLALPSPYQGSRMTWLPDSPSRILWLQDGRAVALDVASGRETADGFAYPASLGPGVVNIRTFFSADQRTLVVREGAAVSELAEGRAWKVWRRGADGQVAESTVLEGVPATPNVEIHPANGAMVTSAAGLAGIWDLRSGKRGLDFGRDQPVAGAVFSPDGKSVGFRTSDGTVQVCDYPDGRTRFVVRGADRDPLISGKFSPDSALLITSDTSGEIQFWRGDTGELLRRVSRHRSAASIDGFSSDGRRFVSYSDDGTAQVWDLAARQPVGELLTHAGAVSRAIFSPSGRIIATITRNGIIRFWDAETSQPLTEPAQHQGSTAFGGAAGGVIPSFEFSPDGQFLLTRGSAPEVFRIWPVPPDGRQGAVPPWLLRLATLCASKRLTDDGAFLSAADEVARMDEIRRELDVAPEDAPFVKWGRWFLAESSSRSIAPGFTITPTDAKKLGEETRKPPPLITLNQRSQQMRTQRRWDDAITVDRESLELVRKQFGPESKVLSDQLLRLAQTQILAGRFAEAETTARECLAMRTKFYSETDWQIANARSVIGEAASRQGRHAEAEPVLLATYARINEAGATAAPPAQRARAIANTLAQLYTATNQPEKAAEWRAKATPPAAAPANPPALPANQPAPGGGTPATPAPAAPDP